MLRSPRARGSVRFALGLVTVVAAIVLLGSDAHSQQAKPLALRVSELEQKLKKLEARLDALEKRAPSAVDKGAVARFPSARDECNPPYTLDDGGIRRVKPECAGPTLPCDPPFTVDARGYRSPKKDCF